MLSEPAPGISAHPSEENARYFNVMIIGPTTSPYEGGVYKLELYLPEDYPMAAPKVSDPRMRLRREVLPHLFCAFLFLFPFPFFGNNSTDSFCFFDALLFCSALLCCIGSISHKDLSPKHR